MGRSAQIRKGTEQAGCRAGQRCRTSAATRHQGQPGSRTAAHRESPASARARGGTFSPDSGFSPMSYFPASRRGCVQTPSSLCLPSEPRGLRFPRFSGRQEHSQAPATTAEILNIKLPPEVLSQQDGKQHPGPGVTVTPAAVRASPLQAVQKSRRPGLCQLLSCINVEVHFIQVSLIYLC